MFISTIYLISKKRIKIKFILSLNFSYFSNFATIMTRMLKLEKLFFISLYLLHIFFFHINMSFKIKLKKLLLIHSSSIGFID